MVYEPDYSKYTLDELRDAGWHINREKYPERARILDEEIERRLKEEIGQSLPTNDLSKKITIKFRGKAHDYFRIWIVNLCLSLITLGIFSAWAKVRKKRYLYSHILLGGTPFQYLGQPVPIFKGRVIAALAFLVYYLSSHFFTSILPYVLLVGLVAAPWMVVRSVAFNARYSAFRNIAFKFDGNYLKAFRVLYVWGIVPAIFIILFLGMNYKEKETAIIFVLVFFILASCFPWWIKSLKKFIVEHTSYGGKYGSLSATGGQFFRIYFMAGLITIAIITPAGLLSFVLNGAANKTFALYLMVILIYAGYALAYAYLQAQSGNLVWNNTRLGPLRFQSTLRGRDLIKLYLTNAIGILLSAGLLIPWAVIRTIKYRVDHMHVLLEGDLNEFLGSHLSTVTAVGTETMDFFDVDLSL